MIALIQRVTQANVAVAGKIIGSIDNGLVVLLGVQPDDDETKSQRLAQKVCQYRVFSDDQGKMNRSLIDVQGQALVISQFTLPADTRKGNRPSFTTAAPPALGESLYHHFVKETSALVPVETGEFGAEMAVSLVNDGPVTFWLSI